MCLPRTAPFSAQSLRVQRYEFFKGGQIMKRSLILSLPLLMLTVSCGTFSGYTSQQRYADGVYSVYAAAEPKPLYTVDDFDAMAMRNIREKQKAGAVAELQKDTVYVILRDDNPDYYWAWSLGGFVPFFAWNYAWGPGWYYNWHDPWYWSWNYRWYRPYHHGFYPRPYPHHAGFAFSGGYGYRPGPRHTYTHNPPPGGRASSSHSRSDYRSYSSGHGYSGRAPAPSSRGFNSRSATSSSGSSSSRSYSSSSSGSSSSGYNSRSSSSHSSSSSSSYSSGSSSRSYSSGSSHSYGGSSHSSGGSFSGGGSSRGGGRR